MEIFRCNSWQLDIGRQRSAFGFGNPDPEESCHQKGKRADGEGGSEAVFLSEGADGEGGKGAGDTTGVVREALRGGADSGVIDLRGDGSEAGVVASAKERDEGSEEQE